MRKYSENKSLAKYIIFGFAFILILISGNAFAQGSPYDLLGFGDPIVSEAARLEGIEGSGVALTDSRTINDINPAALSMLTRARIEARLRFVYDRSSFGSEQSIQRPVKFAGVSFATSLWERQHIGFALGFVPLTNAEAKAQQTDTNVGTTVYHREGGLSQFYLGLSARPISALNLGARADFLFGNLRLISQSDVSQGQGTTPGVFQREYSAAGVRGTFGFLLTLDTLLPELKGLTIGGAFSSGSSLTSKKRTIVTPVNSLLDSTIEVAGFGYYPSLIRLGIATRFGDRYRVEADISGQDFSTASLYSTTSTIVGDPNLGPSNRYSIGIERLPIMGDEAKGVGFWERTGLRLGASYATLPFRPNDLTKPSDPNARTSVNELSFSLGLGLPMNYESLFDFFLGAGIRTPQAPNGAPKDFFFKMGASISLSEKWFVPLRRDED